MTLHIDGFDQFLNDQSFGPALTRAGYLLSGSPPSGVAAKNGLGLGLKGGAVMRAHPWVTNLFSVGCAMQFSVRGSILWLDFGNDERVVLWTSPDDGQPRLNGDIGGALPVTNTWYYFEVEINRVANTASLFINNRADVVTTLTPTMAAAVQVTVGFGMLAPSTYRPGVTIGDFAQKDYDDVYIYDGPRHGPVRITTRRPQHVAKSEWLAAGGENSAVILSQLPPDPMNKYIASDEDNAGEEFKSLTPLPNDNPILATGLVVLTRKSPGFHALLRGFIGDDEPGAKRREYDMAVGADWELRYMTFGREGSDTKAGIETAPFGIIVNDPS